MLQIKYRKTFPEAVLLERFSEDGGRREYTLTSSEDAVIYPIQHTGKPSLLKTGVILEGIEKEGAVLYATLLPSIMDNTGLVLLNPVLNTAGGEIVLRVANLARNVQTIQRGSMLANISVFTSGGQLEFVKATAQPTTRRRKQKSTNNERK